MRRSRVNKKYVEAGFDSFILCSDYCFNSGPFLSPAMFENSSSLIYMRSSRKRELTALFMSSSTLTETSCRS